ncbi:dephospho-CoA kinase [Brachybacterium endophyticum]|uniref:Dephospho-CoA kinase n=1 Tax=Brachybacterium endophyticum TaxID=2182385 RepID=A0A2U2RIR9_9MICO|nr:dephospho-CoA kinase [Brachybacterium endophyticum]PWH05777.1 dephospho-CoA kinase [Brachybacterium endophyticum]
MASAPDPATDPAADPATSGDRRSSRDDATGKSSAPARIGLTGGIGAGKSTVARTWREAGLTVIDLDAHSRAVLDTPGDGLEEAVERFGEGIRAASGTVDRPALARLVFSDPAARADLEAIVLRRVDEAVIAEEVAALQAGETLVVHDNPLLLEKRREDEYDAVVAVLARREDRIERVVRDRDRDRAYVESVMAAQVSDLERIRRADHLLLNTAAPEILRARSLVLLERLRQQRTGTADLGETPRR